MQSTTKGQHSFARAPSTSIQRSSFDRSSGQKLTMDAGLLIPFYADEALPADSFNLKTACFGRIATPIYPFMDNLTISTFYFAVPMRLLWDNWSKMNGEQTNPDDSTDFIAPISVAPAGGYANGSLQDYLGLPTQIEGYEHNTFHQRAYNLIWNEWFRDQNLQDSLPVATGDGPDDVLDYTIQRRGKRHDYFTSALPWPQKGDAVTLPLGTTAPVQSSAVGGEWFVNNVSGNPNDIQTLAANNNVEMAFTDSSGSGYALTAEVDLASATSVTINALREAVTIQQLLEKDARGGTRLTEIIYQHFKVISPDSRMQRPEFLGGGSSPININPVQQTSDLASVAGTGTVGTLGAQGTISFTGHGFTKSFTEHCVIIGLASINADLTYQQGLPRMFSRSSRLDWALPVLANLGEQEVLNKEIYCQGTAGGTADDEVFGYQERYADYRYKPSQISGLFRSNDATTLDAWHLAQEFGSLPTLSSTFIEDNPPIDRVIATVDEPAFIMDFYHKCVTARPLPLFGIPGLNRF